MPVSSMLKVCSQPHDQGLKDEEFCNANSPTLACDLYVVQGIADRFLQEVPASTAHSTLQDPLSPPGSLKSAVQDQAVSSKAWGSGRKAMQGNACDMPRSQLLISSTSGMYSCALLKMVAGG